MISLWYAFSDYLKLYENLSLYIVSTRSWKSRGGTTITTKMLFTLLFFAGFESHNISMCDRERHHSCVCVLYLQFFSPLWCKKYHAESARVRATHNGATLMLRTHIAQTQRSTQRAFCSLTLLRALEEQQALYTDFLWMKQFLLRKSSMLIGRSASV